MMRLSGIEGSEVGSMREEHCHAVFLLCCEVEKEER